MRQTRDEPTIPWLEPGMPFPPVEQAMGVASGAPGLLAAGGVLDVQSLLAAYRHGIFPWFSEGQPILWWSTDPRMVLQIDDFRLHPSLRKTLRRFKRSPGCEIRIDSAFGRVIRHCAGNPRKGSPTGGTWILPQMQQAYLALHEAGHAHSVETWIDGELVGGLYCVSIGQAVYGESMFALARDASKIALAALVAFCRAHGIRSIDCQQNTAHLASLGAAEMPRAEFVQHCAKAIALPAPRWNFEPLYWQQLLAERDANQ
jgi:leucyl/phenylalanyl-tRNA---protein transferase